MSVSLAISRSGRPTEFASLCVQADADHWVPGVARRRGFKVLTGTWPVYVHPEDLEQVIHEVRVLREEAFEFINEPDDRFIEADLAANRNRWDLLVSALEQLATEDGWEADFGQSGGITSRCCGPARVAFMSAIAPAPSGASRCPPQSVPRYAADGGPIG